MSIYVKLIIVVLGLIIMLNGCTTSAYYYNDGITAPSPTTGSQIKIFSEREIQGNYTELGYVTVYSSQQIEGDDLKALLRDDAAKMGADAIIGFKLYGYSARGIAVKYK